MSLRARGVARIMAGEKLNAAALATAKGRLVCRSARIICYPPSSSSSAKIDTAPRMSFYLTAGCQTSGGECSVWGEFCDNCCRKRAENVSSVGKSLPFSSYRDAVYRRIPRDHCILHSNEKLLWFPMPAERCRTSFCRK